ncbi:glycosyl hydrolase family 18 protein [Sorangium sp. So ce1153]|uniref:glycosyl hydrolase family 18 protein n=1 Tax=Sorangium sp. So ce1153 TaxID=3133333 RepID=UPI003F5F9AF9
MLLNSTVIAPRLSLVLVAVAASALGCLGAGSSQGEIDVGRTEAAACAGSPEWQEGQWYDEGAIVNYEGVAYIAEHGNPGYIPTVSTYFWEPYSGCSESPDPGGESCSYPQWQEGQWYDEGAIVNYEGAAYVAEHGNPGYIPTVSTYFWEPHPGCSESPDPGPGPGPAPGGGLPAKVVAGYYPNWTPSPIRIRDINSNYNVIYLFAATPVGGSPGTTGAVEWRLPDDGRDAAKNFNADVQYARTAQGRKIILSIGGARNGMSFPDRQKSQTFVDSVVDIYNDLGGFDGIDWNTFEADQNPDTAEMIWISLELKRRFPGFIITAPPAPWNERDKKFCEDMVNAGAMDYAAPQYYDGPDLDQQSYIVENVNDWVRRLGPTHVAVGFGIWDETNYMSIDEAIPTWNEIEANHPTLRGAFDWQIHIDESQGWPFADRLGPLVKD